MPWLVVSNGQILNVLEYDGEAELSLPVGQTLVDYTGTAVAAPGYAWNGTDPVPPAVSALTVQQQGQIALRAGVQVNFTVQAALSGLYAVDEAAQNRLSRMFALIERAGDVFPAGQTTLNWADKQGRNHVFADVATFLAFEDTLSKYALAVDQAALSGVGAVPQSPLVIDL